MKRLLNLKFLLALVAGAGLVAAVSAFSKGEGAEEEHLYGDPDNDTSGEDVSSFVD
jgi:hypothetical protein